MKTFVWGGVIVACVVGGAISAAFFFGQRSPIHASGTINLDPRLSDDAKGIRTLFVILYDDGANAMPMPYGAVRWDLNEDAKGPFFDFMITPEVLQVMIPDRPLPKQWRIKARLDQDGSAGPDQPGDLTGVIRGVGYGAKDVKLFIDKKI